MAKQRVPASILALTAAGEPYRLLFPLGALLGVVGVLLWPAFVWGGWEVYPAQAHARIMIQGFLGAFVVGFLGTALPRLLDVPRVGLTATLTFAVGFVVMVVFQILDCNAAGDGMFLLLLTTFLVLLAMKARHRRDTPPPGFVLVGMGMACAWAGTVLLLLSDLGVGVPPWLYRLARLLAWQGFLLLPVMGVGAFLLPRFFGLPNQQAFPELLIPTAEWKRKAAFAAGCGGLILASFVLESCGWLRWGVILRAGSVFIYFLREVPLHKAKDAKGSLAWALRIALLAFPLGYLLVAAFPAWQLAMLHVVFIAGFGLITFTVASRVILGHSGQSDRFKSFLPPVVLMTILFLVALLLRVGADFTSLQRFSLYGISAVVWVVAVVVWSAGILPGIRYADDE